MKRRMILALAGMILPLFASRAADEKPLRVRLSWGHQASTASLQSISLLTSGAAAIDPSGYLLEPEDGPRDGAWRSRAGAGDVDGIEFTLRYPDAPLPTIRNLHPIWRYLLAESDADTRRRLTQDPAHRLDPRCLTVRMNAEGTRGFSVAVGQILDQRALWVPSLDVFIAAGDTPVSFDEHQEVLEPYRGRRILDAIRREPEATFAQFAARWDDMGHPRYVHAAQPFPGHIIGVTWDSAIPKFGIDRGAGVWSDLGNPDRFRFWFDFGDLTGDLAESWKGQRLLDGLPIVTTVIEKDGVRYEVEQFAYPLDGPPSERRGDIAMVLLQKVRMTDLAGPARTVPVAMTHLRRLPADSASSGVQPTLFVTDGIAQLECKGPFDAEKEMKRFDVTARIELPAGGSREWIIKFPSPIIGPEKRATLEALDYDQARRQTIAFWSDLLARGARFEAPEKIVNDLFRANLWHALRLPRRHGGPGDVAIDLPYSNFAYGQNGTPWPVNESVYVDFMLYDLRGYHDVSAEELAVIYRNAQEPNGHIKGYANWVVNTPSMLYVVAKQYLLTHDRAQLERLFEPSLKAMDWCLGELERAGRREGPTRGLVFGPLNDGTGEGVWAFNQAYLYAGLDLFGRVLESIGHPRAPECREAAQALRRAIDTGFHAAAVRSPLVPLRDRTWTPYVPCEATAGGRLMSQWYPTDVDTGAVHLIRLQAVAPDGDLADALLHDHEDNSYLAGWGMANEPVYNQQATAYLLRDDPAAAVRAFYSYMACAFSHAALEPVEHRYAHGQYFGPPSTDGAWFDLYRHMLIREADDGTLLLAQATPRAWLADGKRIAIERAPTDFGPLALTIESRATAGEIRAEIRLSDRNAPRTILLRLRHPQAKPMRSVTVNGQPWRDFDASKEWVRIDAPRERRYAIVARYE